MSFGVPLNIQICKTENELFFGSLDLYLAGISLYVIVENHRLSKYIRAWFIDIDAYQQGQVSDGTCTTKAWVNNISINLTTQFAWDEEVIY